jgi:hypothetical protein
MRLQPITLPSLTTWPWGSNFFRLDMLKGLGHETEFKDVYGQKRIVLFFLNFLNAPRMRCRHCNFPCGKGLKIFEK